MDGAPMGSPLSLIMANIFMENVKLEPRTPPSINLSYGPDMWMILSSYEHTAKTNYRNSSHFSSIQPKITMKTKKRNQLQFLNILVIKKQDGILAYTTYRKTTHTNRYLNSHSHHHPAQIQGVAKTLVSRSQRLTDADRIQTKSI
ncbi:hypothetical protein Trydic_g22663 [Trypoxylus dichotomus]